MHVAIFRTLWWSINIEIYFIVRFNTLYFYISLNIFCVILWTVPIKWLNFSLSNIHIWLSNLSWIITQKILWIYKFHNFLFLLVYNLIIKKNLNFIFSLTEVFLHFGLISTHNICWIFIFTLIKFIILDYKQTKWAQKNFIKENILYK